MSATNKLKDYASDCFDWWVVVVKEEVKGYEEGLDVWVGVLEVGRGWGFLMHYYCEIYGCLF